MFWLLKKIFWLAVIIAIVYYGSNYRIDDKPIKQYLSEFYNSPIVQSAVKAGKDMVQEFLDEKMGEDQQPAGNEPAASRRGATDTPVEKGAGDELTEQDKKALDSVLQQQK